MRENILEINDLTVAFASSGEELVAIENIGFSIAQGETVALVGESGCGKSVTSLSILKLLDEDVSTYKSGSILFEQKDLMKLGEKELRKIRGNAISMIFQEPMTSLNPVFTVGDQIAEVFQTHRGMSRSEALDQAVSMLDLVGLSDSRGRIKHYPHQLSGGMRQRVMIAMALACHPKLLIADEPTTALDVTIQAQILDLMNQLKKEFQMAILLVTHDLGVVAEFCDRVMVMYSGRIVESASVSTLFSQASHPYTQGLLSSIPRLDQKQDILPTIPGSVPRLQDRGSGCYFADRCSLAQARCRAEVPALVAIAPDHYCACHFAKAKGEAS